MTAKRFRLGYVCRDFGLIDNDEWIDLHSMSENSEKNVQICINKMNELADENERLKHQLQQQEMEYATTCNRLTEENEQLQIEKSNLKKQHGYELFKKLQYKSDLINAKKENEQLRKELDAFKPVMFQDMRKGTVILYSKEEVKE